MDRDALAPILCVDDESDVLDGLEINLRRRFRVHRATSGANALQVLDETPGIVAVLSDLRMPLMDGVALLGEVRSRRPDVVRLILTGASDLTAAIAAVNHGQVFRFLTKPCPPPELLSVVAAAVEQHRLITAERVLLEQTHNGSLQALVDVLGLANPASFGHASRVKSLVTQLGRRLEVEDRWQIEVAAMLFPLGWISLPKETQESLLAGEPLPAAEAAMVRRVPGVTDALLKNIPRLDKIRAMISVAADERVTFATASRPTEVGWGAGLLRAASDYDLMAARGDSPGLVIETMRSRIGRYPDQILDALAALALAEEAGPAGSGSVLREVPLGRLSIGMVLAEDLRTGDGILLAARGYEVSVGLVERATNLPESRQRQAVRVLVPAAAAEEAAARQEALIGTPPDPEAEDVALE